jgi:hypothetical protein
MSSGDRDLDAALWSPARLPLPRGEHVPLNPDAELAVGDGEAPGKISRFSLSDDRFQAADGVRWLILSTRQFELPADRPVTFAVDLAVQNISGDPVDNRPGIAEPCFMAPGAESRCRRAPLRARAEALTCHRCSV